MTTINYDEIDQAFYEQRELSVAAHKVGLGLESFYENLGANLSDILDWSYRYVKDNHPEFDEQTTRAICSSMARTFAMGIVLGRRHLPQGA